MALDVAELGLSVNTGPVEKADTALDKFAASAKGAEGAAGKFEKGADGAARATDRLSIATKVGAAGFDFMKAAIIAAAAAAISFAAHATLDTFIDNTVEAQKVQAQLAAALKSTHGASGQTVDGLNAQAAALQKVTNFGDEAIGTAQSILLTFTKIGGEVFPQATVAVTNLAERLGGDLQGAAIQVGKALNDPILGVTALGRAGIQFTQSQKDMIKSLVEGGNQLGAQTIILKELETQFGGSAKAARDTLGGALLSLSNAFGDMFEISKQGSENLRVAIEHLIAVFQDPAVMAFVQMIGTALFNALSVLINVIADVVAAIPPIWDALSPLLPLLMLTFGPTVVGMLITLATAGFGAVMEAVVALFAVLAANPLVAFGVAVAALLSYLVDWDNLGKNLTLTWGAFVETIGKALDALGIANTLTSDGYKIQVDAVKAAQDLKDAGASSARRMYDGVDTGGESASKKMKDGVDQGGQSAAKHIKEAQDLAMARYLDLNGVAAQVLGDKLIEGGNYIYNQVTGSITKASEDGGSTIKQKMIEGGNGAAGAIGAAIAAAGTASASVINEATISVNQAAASAASALSSASTQMGLGFIPGGTSNEGAAAAQASIARHSSAADAVRRQRQQAAAAEAATRTAGGYHKSFDIQSYASGGDFTVGGSGGVDSQPVSFMATPGEHVSIDNKANANKDKGGVNLKNVVILDAREIVSAMATDAGQQVVVGMFRADPAKWRAILGV